MRERGQGEGTIYPKNFSQNVEDLHAAIYLAIVRVARGEESSPCRYACTSGVGLVGGMEGSIYHLLEPGVWYMSI